MDRANEMSDRSDTFGVGISSGMRNKGLHTHRFKDNPEEKRFAEKWDSDNASGYNLAYLLDPKHGTDGRPPEPSDRDRVVAATVIQWLGSPVGQNFLRDLGYDGIVKP